MATSIARLAIDLVVNSSGLQKEFTKALRPMRKFGSEMTAIGKDLSMKVTAPIVGMGVGILKAAGDFEAGMNRVQAITGATSEQFTDLRNRAKELGATTQFSATEAAGGIEMLAKNGLKYQDIVDGALESTLRLSAATGSDLSRAADIATDAMLAFGIEAKNMEQAVDAITGVTLNSKFDIEGYAYALANAGGVASSVGVEFEDFNATIAAIAPSFSSGMTAGTSFKSFLAKMKPTSKPAIEAMAALKLSFFDTQGQMDDMATVAQKLQKAFGGLSEEEKLAKGIQIFGTEGVRAAFAIMNAGADDITRLKSALADTSAADQATARMKGLNGAMLKLKSALEAVAIAIADSGLLEWVTKAATWLSSLFSELSKTNPEILKIGSAIAAVTAAIGPLLVALGALVAAFAPLAALISAKGGLVASLALLMNPLTALIGVVAGLTAAWALWGEEIDTFLTDFFTGLILAFDDITQMISKAGAAIGGFISGLPKRFQPLMQVLSETGDAFIAFVSSWQESLLGWDQKLADSFSKFGGYFLVASDFIVDLRDLGQRAFKSIGLYVEQMVARIQNWLADKLLKITETAGGAVDKLKGKFYDLANAVVFNSYIPDMVDLLGEEFKRMQNTFVQPSIDSLQELQDEFKKTGEVSKNVTYGPDKKPSIGNTYKVGDLFSIGSDMFKLPTAKASSEVREFEKQIGGVLNTEGQQSIDQLVGRYEKMGNDIGEGILGIGDGLDGIEDKFKLFSKSFIGQFSGLLTNITDKSKGFDLFGSLGLGSLGNIFSGGSGKGGGITDILGINGGGGGGDFGVLSMITGFAKSLFGGVGGLAGVNGPLFGGFFADGGSPPVGKVSVVGERGPELFVPRTSGTILPNESLSGISSRRGDKVVNVYLTQHNNFESGVTEAGVVSIVREHGKQTIKVIQDQMQRGGAFRANMQ